MAAFSVASAAISPQGHEATSAIMGLTLFPSPNNRIKPMIAAR
jgi:hypothetical protein